MAASPDGPEPGCVLMPRPTKATPREAQSGHMTDLVVSCLIIAAMGMRCHILFLGGGKKRDCGGGGGGGAAGGGGGGKVAGEREVAGEGGRAALRGGGGEAITRRALPRAIVGEGADWR